MKTYAFDEKRENARDLIDVAFQKYAEKNAEMCCLSPDLVRSGMAAFSKKYPDRTYNLGIAETSCIDFAAGMAAEGRKPVIYGMSAFLSMRSCEAIRTNLCYQNFHVVIFGNNTGLAQGPAGSTHYAMEDLSILRIFPNMTLIAPADADQTVKAFYAAMEMEGPVYIRMSNGRAEPAVYQGDYDFQIGKGIEIQSGEEVCVMATGISVPYAVEAGKRLAAEGISAAVVDMHTLKPMDRELILKMAEKTGRIVTVEDGFITGGLGTGVCEVVAEVGIPCKVKRLGIPDLFPGFGSFSEQMDFYGYDTKAICKAAKELLC